MAKQKQEKPRDQDLPGLEDRAIQPLHKLAQQYNKKVLARQKIKLDEMALEVQLREEMKKHNRTRYAYDGVEVVLSPRAAEKVKVTVAES